MATDGIIAAGITMAGVIIVTGVTIAVDRYPVILTAAS
jgi:hypothetical protein